MKSVLLGLAIGLMATEAHAISRYNTSGLSCGEVRAIVDRDGAAIMRYRSARSGAQLYGRYVRDGRWCAGSERPEFSYITTSDNDQCRVRECKPYSLDDDGILFQSR